MIRKYATIVMLVLLGSSAIHGQEYTPEDRYLQSRIEPRELDRERWADLTEGFDYSERKRSPEHERRGRPGSGSGGGNRNALPIFGEGVGAAIARFLLIVIGAILIALLVRSMLGYGRVKNKKIKRDNEGPDIKKIEENLHEADLNDFIRQAKETGDFNLAVRLYYLAVLKALSLQKVIKWKVDKTNSEYLREIRATPYFSDFRMLTFIFEQSWYGDRPLNAADFADMEPRFSRFINQVSPTPQVAAL